MIADGTLLTNSLIPDGDGGARHLNISLTGASGYVGSTLLHAIEMMPEGAVRVRALAMSKAQLLTSLGWVTCPDWLTVVEGRLPAPPAALFFDTPHVLVHFAVKQIDNDGSGFQLTNIEGTRSLLAQTNPHTLGVIYGSTLSVLGQGAQQAVTENAPISPETDLAKSRAAAEELCYQWGERNDRVAYGLRPRFILGRHDRFVLSGLAKLVRKRQGVGHGQQQFSVINVEDYTRVILALVRRINADSAAEQTPLNVGYRETVRFCDLQYFLAEALGVDAMPTKRIPNFRWLPWLMRLLPVPGMAQKATQLELIGFDHYSDVSALELRVGADVTDKPIRTLLRETIRQWVEQNAQVDVDNQAFK